MSSWLKESNRLTLCVPSECSIAVATKLVREGKAQAVFSADLPAGYCLRSNDPGNGGRYVQTVLGGPIIGFAPKTVVMDVGGNVDVRPDQLLDLLLLVRSMPALCWISPILRLVS
jgi:fatty acid/phospholipid biosynthesis enzyme